ncbi:MAG: ATP-binding cassette domain-containing protein, partial [Xanthomonadales bacterium]
MADIRCHELCKTYRQGDARIHALDHVTLDVEPGSFICLSGPSGSGKTTLLNAIGGLDELDSGEISIDGTIGEVYQGGLTNRSIIYSGNLAELEELEHHIEERREEAQELNAQTLYPYDEYEDQFYKQGHWWAMHIDLNACIGCGAC